MMPSGVADRPWLVKRAWLYLAQVRFGRVDIYRDDGTRVDTFTVEHGVRLRLVLVKHGWCPTGGRVAGRGWDVLMVEPTRSPSATPL